MTVMYEIEAEIDANEIPVGYCRYWLRIKDNDVNEIEDIPVDFPYTIIRDKAEFNQFFVEEWTKNVAACDCIRGLRFYKMRNQPAPSNLQCGHKRMRLMGIWDDRRIQIFGGE